MNPIGQLGNELELSVPVYFFLRRKTNLARPRKMTAEDDGSGTEEISMVSEAGAPPSRVPIRIALLESCDEMRNPKFCVGSSTIA